MAPVSVFGAGGAAERITMVGAGGGPPLTRGAGGGAAARGAVGAAGGAAAAGGRVTGEVGAFGAGGGSGVPGRLIGAVARLAVGGMMDWVVIVGTLPDEGATGAVDSRGWVTPAPGRARRVMRTVSFFRGTEDVFGVEEVFSGSAM